MLSTLGRPDLSGKPPDDVFEGLAAAGLVRADLFALLVDRWPNHPAIHRVARLWLPPRPLGNAVTPGQERYWVQLGGHYSVDRDDFLDPSELFGHRGTHSLVGLPFGALLGEPGSGKSTELRRIWRELGVADRCAAFVDMGACSSAEHLRSKVFNAVWLDQWRRGTGDLWLLLDSLDEAGAQLPGMARALVGGLRDLPLDRLRLLVCCRTGAWPTALDAELRAVWKEQRIELEDTSRAFELLPLRAVDVHDALRAVGTDVEAFLRAVRLRQLGALAARPMTLHLLLRVFDGEDLPKDKVSLYRAALMEMASPRERLAAGHRLARHARRRMETAGRVAVAMALSGKWTVDPAITSPADDAISIRDLVGQETTADECWTVTEEDLSEVLFQSALFTAAPGARRHFEHRTFAEFLAADYLLAKGWSDSAGLRLLGSEAGMAPQLEQVAAWMAATDATTLEVLAASNPTVLLQTDPAVLTDDLRQSVVEYILATRADGEEADDLRSDSFRNLAYPGLEARLRQAFARDGALHPIQDLTLRRTAIRMAEGADVRAVAPDLLRIAADSSEPPNIRNAAVYAAKRLEADNIAVWKSLAYGECGPDPDHELRGVALHVLWPSHISAGEVAKAVTAAWRSNFFGAYWRFIQSGLVEDAMVDDLPTLLDLVPGGIEDRGGIAAGDLVSKLLGRAVAAAPGHPGVLAAVVNLFFTVRHPHQIPDCWDDTTSRRLVAHAVVADERAEGDTLWKKLAGLIRRGDMMWALRNYDDARDEAHRECWRDATKLCFDPSNPDETDALLNACTRHPGLRQLWSNALIGPIDIDSEEASRMREVAERLSKKEHPLIKPSPAERLEAWLDRTLEQPQHFPQVMSQLTLEPRSTHYSWPFRVAYQELPGWRAAGHATRAKVLDRAEAFLITVDPKPEEWFGTKSTPGDAWGGCCAATMLFIERPHVVTGHESWWGTWAATFVELSEMYKSDAMLKVVELATTHAPEAIVVGLKLRLDASSDATDYEIALQKVCLTPLPSVHRVLTSEVWDASIAPERRAAALSALVKNAPDEAWQALLKTLEGDERQPTQLRVRAATARFYRSQLDDEWWVRVARNDELASGVAHEVADWRITFDGQWNQPAPVLAGMYRWIRERHPQRRRTYGTPSGGMEATGPMDWIVELRNRLLPMLAKRARDEDVAALERLTEAFPDLIWAREEAKKAHRQKQWSPTKPREILRLIRLGPPPTPLAVQPPKPEFLVSGAGSPYRA